MLMWYIGAVEKMASKRVAPPDGEGSSSSLSSRTQPKKRAVKVTTVEMWILDNDKTQ